MKKKVSTKKSPTLTKTDVPMLVNVLRGYLHEDYEAEYGSAVSAVRAFVDDASEDEVKALKADLARMGVTMTEDGLKAAGPDGKAVIDAYRAQ